MLTPDFYTKFILTVIATALSVIAFSQFMRSHCRCADLSGPKVSRVGLVAPQSGVIDVNIKSISTSDELNVNLEEINGSSIWGREIPVNVANFDEIKD